MAHTHSSNGMGPDAKRHASFELRSACEAFCTAMRGSARSAPMISLHDFPSGACGDASLLLARYLADSGLGTTEYVSGWWGDQGHAWLELDGLIIDVTASQFDPELPEAFVSSDRTWHLRFTDLERRPSDFESYDARTASEFGRVYKWLLVVLARRSTL